MSFHRLLALVPVLVLASVVSACASGGTASAEGGETAAAAGNATEGSSTLITRAQLATYSGRTAYEAVEQFNRRWLRATRGGGAGGGASSARVVIDERIRDTLGVLNRTRADDVESMRFIDANAAIRKYGTEFTGGAIEVTSRGR